MTIDNLGSKMNKFKFYKFYNWPKFRTTFKAPSMYQSLTRKITTAKLCFF